MVVNFKNFVSLFILSYVLFFHNRATNSFVKGIFVLQTVDMLVELNPSTLSVCESVKTNQIRGHSRNHPKGGRNSPQRYTGTLISDNCLS